jgi:hypothetical protein
MDRTLACFKRYTEVLGIPNLEKMFISFSAEMYCILLQHLIASQHRSEDFKRTDSCLIIKL